MAKKNGFNYDTYECKKSYEWCQNQFGDDIEEVMAPFLHSVSEARKTATRRVSFVQTAMYFQQTNQADLDAIAKEAGEDKSKYTVEQWNHLLKSAAYILTNSSRVSQKKEKRSRRKGKK